MRAFLLLWLYFLSRLHPIFNHDSRVLVVPATYADVKTCIRQLRNGDRMYIQTVDKTFRTWEGGERGWHSWKGRVFVTNEPLWRGRRAMFPYSGAKTVQELDQLYQDQEQFGKDIFNIELTDIKGVGRISVHSDPYVKLSGQIVLW